MKTRILLIFLILASSRIFGQLNVNAGNDTFLCTRNLKTDSAEIGGNPTASGGIEPYTYTWSIDDSFSLGASYFLDDSTKANPKIVNAQLWNPKIKLKLTVRDSMNNQAEDSINVQFSVFFYTLIYFSIYIDKGDTIKLGHNITEGIPPLKYSWTPNYNISDPSFSNPRAWPDTTIIYRVVATDSIGCESSPSTFSVYVNPVAINSPKELNRHSIVFPNPIDNKSEIRFSNPNHNKFTISIINANGRKVLSDIFSTNTYLIGNKITKSGFYIYSISNGSEIVTNGKFIKE